MIEIINIPTTFKRLTWVRDLFWFISIIGILIGLAIGYLHKMENFHSAYLIGFLLCLGFSLGPCALWLLHNLVGGEWGQGMAISMRIGTMLVPFCLLLFLPILFGLDELYPWAKPSMVNQDHHLQEKIWYLNDFDYTFRSGIFFAAWIGIAYYLVSRTKNSSYSSVGSAIGLIVYFLTISFASFDWIMSLEPLFYSSIFGLIVVAGQLTSAYILSVFTSTLLPIETTGNCHNWNSQISHDIGNFLLMSVMFWTYLGFSQLLLIWSAQQPEEIIFYNYRFYGGWEWVGITLIILHFVIPFFFLLFRENKRHIGSLLLISIILLFSRWVEVSWLVLPNFSPASFKFTWEIVVLPLSLGSLWFAIYLTLLKRRFAHV